MKNYLYMLFLIILIFGCKKDKKTAINDIKNNEINKKFDMYKFSQMALLMEQMYVDNERLKERIIKGDTIGTFPNHFLQIHKAVMTDNAENDVFFKQQAAIFINTQELIYKDPKNAKEHFNNSITSCIECHQQKCSGPIPRIKKLYIQ